MSVGFFCLVSISFFCPFTMVYFSILVLSSVFLHLAVTTCYKKLFLDKRNSVSLIFTLSIAVIHIMCHNMNDLALLVKIELFLIYNLLILVENFVLIIFCKYTFCFVINSNFIKYLNGLTDFLSDQSLWL